MKRDVQSLTCEVKRGVRRRGGFTLVECLVAGTVLALFGGTIAIAAAQAGGANRRGVERRAAAQRLDAVLTKIDVLGPARMSIEGPFGGELESDESEQGPRGRAWAWSASIVQEGTWADLYIVEATVRWVGSTGKTRSVSARTRMFDPVGSRTVLAGWDDL